MTVIKGHICPSCAGALSIDIDKQMYICPFCGVTFDYEYFNEDNVLDLGSEALINQEFNSASKAYSYALEKDPHDFEALKGTLCTQFKWRSFGQIKDIKKTNALTPVQRDISALKDTAAEKDKFFFDGVNECIGMADEYAEIIDQMETNENDIRKCDRTAEEFRQKLEDNKNYYDYRFSLLYALYGSFALVIIFLIVSNFADVSFFYFFLVHMVIIGIVFSRDRFSGYKKKKEDASVIAISAMKKEELANKNTELKKQADALKRDFIKKSKVLVEYKSQ